MNSTNTEFLEQFKNGCKTFLERANIHSKNGFNFIEEDKNNFFETAKPLLDICEFITKNIHKEGACDFVILEALLKMGELFFGISLKDTTDK